VDSSNDQIGIVSSSFVGGGAGANADVGLSFQITNANTLQQLAGPFAYLTVSGEYIAGASVTFFSSPDRATYGVEVGVSAGLGVEGAGGISYTTVNQLSGLDALIASAVFDAANPSLSLQDLAVAAAYFQTKGCG
jgi:hypothetical protein